MRLPEQIGLLLVAAAVAAVPGCTTAAPASHPSTSPKPTGRTQPVDTRSGLIAHYQGWDPGDLGGATLVFRVNLLIGGDGNVDGSLELVHVHWRHHSDRVVTFTGTAGPADAYGTRPLLLELGSSVFGVRELVGHAGPVRLRLHDHAHEEVLDAVSTQVDRSFGRHIRMAEIRGGVSERRRRQAMRHASVRHADVDGDGRADTVIVAWQHLRRQDDSVGTVLVLVRLANGVLAATTTPIHDVLPRVGEIAWGLGKLPGFPGRVITVLSDTGAANAFLTVIAYELGTLRVVPGPRPSDWGSGGAVGTGEIGTFCRNGRLYSWADPPQERGRGAYHHWWLTVNGYIWGGATWTRVSHSRRLVGENALSRFKEAKQAVGAVSCP